MFSLLKQQIDNLDIFKIVFDDISYIQDEADKFKIYNDILIFGTGGSSLGAKALVEFKSLLNGEASKVHFIENVDARSFKNVISKCDQNKTGVIAISKSGKTTETLMLLSTLIEMWKDFNWKENALVITENSEKNDLRAIAEKLNIKIIEHHKNIGGRFSVFSVVGLLPAAIAGISITKFLLGAKKCLLELIDENCKIFTEITNVSKLMTQGIHHHVIFAYSDFLQGFGKWATQLISESLGKRDDFGITPVSVTGTIDQHSMLQLFLGGPSDKYYTVITQKNHIDTGKIQAIVDTPVMQSLNNHNIGELMLSHQKATIEVLKDKAHVRVYEFEELDEKAMGYMMMLFVVETLAIAIFMGINPFDQPAVEESKKLAIDRYLTGMSL